MPNHVLQRLARADNAETHRRILETFARDLPISNRYVKRLRYTFISVRLALCWLAVLW